MIAEVRTYYVVNWDEVAALATTAAVFVALGWEPLRRWFNAPKLALTWRGRDMTTEDRSPTYKVRFIRLLVQNAGRSAAQRVEVVVTDAWRRIPDQGWRLVSGFLPTALTWTHTELAWCEQLGGGVQRLCDLGVLTEDGALGAIGGYFRLVTEIDPTSQYNTLAVGDYILQISATAINARPANLSLRLIIGPHAVNGEAVSFSVSKYAGPLPGSDA